MKQSETKEAVAETFDEMGLLPDILSALKAKGYTDPTEIQKRAIPPLLAGKDLLGCAQTGTGKTAAFALPILQRLAGHVADKAEGVAEATANDAGAVRGGRRRHPKPGEERTKSGRRPAQYRPVRALVLTPTRELASQVEKSFIAYGRSTGLRTTVIYGGVSQGPQEEALKRGTDVLVATPGRLLDLYNQRLVDLRHTEVLVLDEADRMLDMGFLPDVRKIIDKIPGERQTLLFSATMPYDIERLANSILSHPVRVTVTPERPTVEAIDQRIYFVEKGDKSALLLHILADPSVTSALVFSRTKHNADRIAERLHHHKIPSEAIHGDRTQKAREKALDMFKSGKVRVLVATDVAARGIDIRGLSHVINYDVPEDPEAYIHRIGRTGRAGATGIALTFCTVTERPYLDAITRLIKKHPNIVDEHPHKSPLGPGRLPVIEPSKSRPASRFLISVDTLKRDAPPVHGHDHAHPGESRHTGKGTRNPGRRSH